jgi:predicted transcriptional regulator
MPSLLSQMLFGQLPKTTQPGRLVKPYYDSPQAKLSYGSVPEKTLQFLKLEQFPVTCKYLADKIGIRSRLMIGQLNRLVQAGLVVVIRQDGFNEYALSEGGKAVAG